MDIALSALTPAFDAIIVVDPSGNVVSLDPAGRELFGLAPGDPQPLRLGELLEEDDARALLAPGAERRVPAVAVPSEGRRSRIEVIPATLQDGTGNVALLVRAHRGERGRRGRGSVDAWWEYDTATGEVRWGSGTYRLHGVTPETFTPSLEAVLGLIEDGDAVQAAVDEVLERGPVRSVEYRIVLPTGVRVLESTVVDEPGHVPGRPGCVYGVITDITALRLTAARLGVHEAVALALREWDEGPDGIRGLLRRMFLAIGWRVGVVWVPDGDVLRCQAFVAESGMEADGFARITREVEPRRGDGTLCGEAWASREVVAVRDIADSSSPRAADISAEGITATVAIPAVHRGDVLAVFEFFTCDQRGDIEGEMLATLGAVGRQLGAFLAAHRGLLAPPVLSPREREVLGLATEGLGVAEIAERLWLSPATIKSHFQNIYEKLGVNDRPAAVAVALRTGIIE